MAGRFPAIWAAAAVMVGILAADTFSIPAWTWFFAALILAFAAVYLYFKDRTAQAGLICLVSLAVLSAFGYSFRYHTFPPGHVIHYVDDDLKHTVYGTIDDWPVIRHNRTALYVAVDSIQDGSTIRPGHGRLLLNINTETTRLQYGDRLFFTARLLGIKGGRSLSGFNYRRYLNLKGVFASAYLPHDYTLQVDPVGSRHFYRLIDRLRGAITGTFTRTLDPDAAALASGFLIGETRDIPQHIYDLFRDSGTLHLLAVSGSNVALVILVFVFLLRVSPIKTVWRSIILLVVIVVFSFLAYNQPSVIRAAVMASLIIIGKAFQRRIDYNNIIAAAALIILLFKPTELFDVGFQLSFITAWGLIFLLPRITSLFKPVQRKLYYKLLIFPLMVCIVAQVVSLPMSAYYFQRMPIISFVSNLIIVPLVSLTVIGEMVVLLSALALPLAGSFFGAMLNPIIVSIIAILEFFGSETTAMLLSFRLPGIILLVYYVILAAVFVAINSKPARRVLVFMLLGTAILTIGIPALAEKEDVKIELFSISRGIIAVKQSFPEQVVLCNLPLKEYYIAEKIIEPYLQSRGISAPTIIALTPEYATIREVVYFAGKGLGREIYVPRSAMKVAIDIAGIGPEDIKTGFFIFYEDNDFSGPKLDQNVIYLSTGTIGYYFDSSAVVIVDRDTPLDLKSFPFLPDNHELVLVKSEVDERDIDLLTEGAGDCSISVVCNRVTARAGDVVSMMADRRSRLPSIVQMSDIGAVSLIVNEGHLFISQ